VLGTTYRDLHAEREYLLKRTIPQVKRQCEEQGILFTLREMKWSEEPVMIARQMNRFLEVLADQDTYYLGIRSDLRPPASNFSTVSTVSSETALRLEALLARKASWREIEEDLVAQALGPERIILLTPSELIGARKTGYIPEELGATIEAQLQSVIDIRSIRERAKADHLDASPLESYHKL
jgi:hypothetical protein